MTDKPEPLEKLANEKILIPDWPQGAVMKIKLGRRSFTIPTKNKQNLLEFRKCKAYVTCQINGQGEVEFQLDSGIPTIAGWLTFGVILSVFSALGCISATAGPNLGDQIFAMIANTVFWEALASFGVYHLLKRGERHLTNNELASLRSLVLFNQFRDEIIKEVEKCVFPKKANQDSVRESLEQAILEKEATLLGIQRLRRDLAKAETEPEIQPTNPFSEPGGSTDGQPSVLQRPEKSALEN